jgi:SAM-dependent methyltransferase
VQASPAAFAGALVLDLGAGTGVGSRAALAEGARVVAVDLAYGMLATARDARPPAAVGDAAALPFAPGSFDVVLAPFSLNHLPDPSAGIAESARAIRTGGVLLASTYAADDDHPVKLAVDAALREAGWRAPDWYGEVKTAMAAWGSVGAARSAIERGGMSPVFVEHRDVPFPELDALDLVAWRLGMAHTAPFFDRLAAAARDGVVARALEIMGPDQGPLVRRVIFLAAR